MKKIGACLFLAGLVSAAPAQTNAPAVRSLSLSDCITEAIRHNFDVRVERYEPLISQLALDAAYAGYDPAFSLSGSHGHNDAGGLLLTNGIAITRQDIFNSDLKGSLPSGATYDFNGNATDTTTSEDTSGSVGVTLIQPLLQNLWIDQTRLNIIAAKNQVKTSEQGLRSQLITTVAAVENAYYELIFARENLEVDRQGLDLAQTQLDQDRQRVQVGSLAPLDVQQDESQVAQSRATLIGAQLTLEKDENTLKTLITDDYAQWHDVDIQPAEKLEAVWQLLDLQDSWNQGLTSRPDFLQAKITLEQQGIQLKFDRNQIYPQLNLTGSFGYNGAGREFSDAFGQYAAANRPFYSAGAEFSVPLSNLKARSAYKSDKALEQQDLLKLKQLEQAIMVEIDNAVKQVQSDWENVQATKEARIYAEAALDAEQKKYAVGKSTTFTVLQLQDNVTTARSQEIRELANYNQDLSALAQQEGSTLERRKVDVTMK